MAKINIPNKLTILRMLLVPIVMVFILYPSLSGNNELLYGIIPTVLFIVTAITDFIDGKIARKYNLITNFGKFMDPVADKFMVICTLMAITVTNIKMYMLSNLNFRCSDLEMIRRFHSSEYRMEVLGRGQS